MRERILIVDDDPVTLKVLRKVVEQELFDVECATSLTEAKSILASTSVQIALCDLLLPDGSGLDLLGHAKERYPVLEVIILTAGAGFDSVVTAIRLGASNYVEKPVSPVRVREVIREAIERQRLSSALHQSLSAPVRALILDDDPLQLKIINNLLTSLHYVNFLTEDIEEAIGVLRNNRVDLIISDIVLADGSGLDFLEQVKKIDPMVPVIMITGSTAVEPAISALRAGAYDYLTKPIQRETFQAAVLRARSLQRSSQERVLLEREKETYRSKLERLSQELDRKVQAAVDEVSALQEFLALILNSLPTSIVATDTQMRITHTNLAAQKLIGVGQNVLDGKPLASVSLLRGLGEKLKEAIDRKIRMNRQKAIIEDLSLGRITVGYGCSPLVDPRSKEVKGGLLFFSDLTGCQDLERTGISVESTASSIAHEINNMLTVAMGYVDLLGLESRLEGEARDHVRRLGLALTRGSKILRERLESEQGDRRTIVKVNLHKAIAQVLDIVELQLAESRIECCMALECPDPLVDSWGNELEQVLFNLVKNAREAMSEGGVLTVSTSSAGSSVRIEVKDTGIGMDPRDVPRLLQPHQTTKPVGKGSGMGLAICRSILARHRGDFVLDTRPGEGCRITLMIPRAHISGLNLLAGSGLSSALPAHCRVFFVDDEPEILDFCAKILSRHQVSVRTFRDARECVVHLETERADLVVSDINMSAMSGIELRDQVLRLNPGQSFFFMTGSIASLGMDSLSKLDGVPILQKPFREQELLYAIQQALRSSARAESGIANS